MRKYIEIERCEQCGWCTGSLYCINPANTEDLFSVKPNSIHPDCPLNDSPIPALQARVKEIKRGLVELKEEAEFLLCGADKSIIVEEIESLLEKAESLLKEKP